MYTYNPLCINYKGLKIYLSVASHLHLCHDPSHGGFYMVEGGFYIRIRLLPRVVSGAASLCLVVDLLIVIFTVAVHIQCLVIEIVLVRPIDLLMFSLSYTWP